MATRPDSGFTLVEVLVAFAILAMVSGAVVRALASGLDFDRTAERATTRVLEARSLLGRLGADVAVSEGSATGVFANGDHWTLTVTRVSPRDEPDREGPQASGLPALYEAHLTIEAGGSPVLSLRTLKLGG